MKRPYLVSCPDIEGRKPILRLAATPRAAALAEAKRLGPRFSERMKVVSLRNGRSTDSYELRSQTFHVRFVTKIDSIEVIT